MRAYNFFLCEPNFTTFFFVNVGRIYVDNAVFRFTHSGDICYQSVKLRKIAPNF